MKYSISGQKLYGRVLWSPEQDLKSAYKLMIEKVFICAGNWKEWIGAYLIIIER